MPIKNIITMVISNEVNEPMMAPSHVFFGETIGASLCLPNNKPLKYCMISELQMTNTKIMMVVQYLTIQM
jgi:hypothetical protein